MEDAFTHFLEDVAYFIHISTSYHIVEDYFIDRGDIFHYIMDMEDYFMDIWHYFIICDIFSHYFIKRGRKSIVFTHGIGISS